MFTLLTAKSDNWMNKKDVICEHETGSFKSVWTELSTSPCEVVNLNNTGATHTTGAENYVDERCETEPKQLWG